MLLTTNSLRENAENIKLFRTYVVVRLQVRCVSFDESLCRHITHALARHDCLLSCQSSARCDKDPAERIAQAATVRQRGLRLKHCTKSQALLHLKCAELQGPSAHHALQGMPTDLHQESPDLLTRTHGKVGEYCVKTTCCLLKSCRRECIDSSERARSLGRQYIQSITAGYISAHISFCARFYLWTAINLSCDKPRMPT